MQKTTCRPIQRVSQNILCVCFMCLYIFLYCAIVFQVSYFCVCFCMCEIFVCVFLSFIDFLIVCCVVLLFIIFVSVFCYVQLLVFVLFIVVC